LAAQELALKKIALKAKVFTNTSSMAPPIVLLVSRWVPSRIAQVAERISYFKEIRTRFALPSWAYTLSLEIPLGDFHLDQGTQE
jgi:hypothetical protein